MPAKCESPWTYRDPGTITLLPKHLATIRGAPVTYYDDLESDEPESPTVGFRALLDELPPIDADIVELKLKGVKQDGIATLLEMTQPAISHRMGRALERLKFLACRPKVTAEELRSILARTIEDKPIGGRYMGQEHRHEAFRTGSSRGNGHGTIDIMVSYWQTGSTTQTTSNLGLNQPTVIRRIRWATDTLECSRDPEARAIGRSYRWLMSAKGWMLHGDHPTKRKAAWEARRAAELLGFDPPKVPAVTSDV